VVVVTTFAGLACGDQGPTPPPNGPANAFLSVSGDRQLSFPGSVLDPLNVRLTDSVGAGLSGTVVTWTTTGGTLTAPSTTTDADGFTFVQHTLRATFGADTIVARTAGRTDSVVFVTYAVDTVPIASSTAVPANYGLHDTYVRDGIAFASVWNSGIFTYDVGDGRAGGSPSAPSPLDTILTSDTGVAGGRQVHNAWWFHNPALNQQRYLFVGQEGPGGVGSSSSGDIHVVDVSNLSQGVEVAAYRMPGAGTHNFWVDEPAQVLYAAYYNGGVVAIDVSGTLTGNLASREIARVQPGGAGNTFTWGVQVHNGSIYAADMLSGLWQLKLNGAALTAVAGGNNVPERYTSDLWAHGNHLYTGTWGFRDEPGNAVKIWRLDAGGAPQLVDSIVVPGIVTVSDIQVSADGQLLVFSTEGGPAAGVLVFDLTDPEKPVPLARSLPLSVHTATIADINGGRYVFAARNPANPAMVVYDITGLP
jgi:hypothetical protein